MSNYFQICGIEKNKISTGFHYVDHNYYFKKTLNLEAVDHNAVDNTVIDEVAGDTDSEEELYQQVLEFVVRTQKASASLLQRKFKIGYNKAARMIDTLEERGVIGPATGNSKPREVLVQFDENSMGEVSE